MDFSGLILIPIAAVITASWIIGAASLSKRGPGFSPPFLLSYGFGVIFMRPWRIAGWDDLGMFAVMLISLAFAVAAGCVSGGLSAVIVVSVGSKLKQRLGR